MNRYGIVYYDNIVCGKIKETDDGYVFSYESSYLSSPNAKAISLNMPLSKEPYISNILHPFFDGLIPEGWLLEIAINKWKIDRKDRMGLLLSVCEDSVGAVSIKGVVR